MSPTEPPDDAPAAATLAPVFDVETVERDGDRLRYVGTPQAPIAAAEEELAAIFYEHGYEMRLTASLSTDGPPSAGDFNVVAQPRSVGIDGIPYKNVALAAATVLTTLYAGTVWYHIDLAADPLAIWRAWPFSLAVLTILGVHEAGHYVASRYHRVDASLPYFIPLPPPFGTAGAIIRMKGRIPNRAALLDIGASGPLAGIAATIAVTTVGLFLDPVSVPQSVIDANTGAIRFNNPPLLRGLSILTGQPLSYDDPTKQLNPVVFAGWLGMLVTFLNLLPVGQLDGGHVLRSLLGPAQERIAALVPAILFALSGGILLFGDGSFEVGIWLVWGVFTGVMAYVGPADPVRDRPLDRRRTAVALLTFLVGALCFMPIPFEIIPPA
mgnify:CR=1 FL=1